MAEEKVNWAVLKKLKDAGLSSQQIRDLDVKTKSQKASARKSRSAEKHKAAVERRLAANRKKVGPSQKGGSLRGSRGKIKSSGNIFGVRGLKKNERINPRTRRVERR